MHAVYSIDSYQIQLTVTNAQKLHDKSVLKNTNKNIIK
jgi:hypothetical protein